MDFAPSIGLEYLLT